MDKKQVVFRFPAKLVADLDKQAKDAHLSRQQLVERLLVHGMAGWKAAQAADDAGLFDDAAALIEQAISKAINEAMRTGGADMALYRAGQIRKKVSKRAASMKKNVMR